MCYNIDIIKKTLSVPPGAPNNSIHLLTDYTPFIILKRLKGCNLFLRNNADLSGWSHTEQALL